jgi:hypothetical protein
MCRKYPDTIVTLGEHDIHSRYMTDSAALNAALSKKFKAHLSSGCQWIRSHIVELKTRK